MRTPTPARRARRVAAALPAVLAVVLAGTLLGPTGPAAAVAPAPVSERADDPVGGPLLSSRGQVVHAAPAVPALPAVTGTAWLVADLDSGAVLAATDPHGRYAPASTLKTLTALALIPELDPARTVVPAPADVNAEGSKVGLVREVAYPVEELFTALLAVSGNDAAGALATAVGGMPAAAELLNAEAARLQARDTVAVNTSGLDAEGQLSSPYDLALIARAGMALPAFREYVGMRTSSVSAPGGRRIEIANHNRLLADYEGATGIKNGYTSRARASFVGAATRDGRSLVVTVMRAEPAVWRDAAALLDWGFAAGGAGVRPVGQLVDPLRPAASAAQPAAAAPAPAPASLPQPVAADGGWDATRWALLGGLLVLLVGLRRRQVVVARRRRRRLRADQPRGGGGRDVLPAARRSGPAARTRAAQSSRGRKTEASERTA